MMTSDMVRVDMNPDRSPACGHEFGPDGSGSGSDILKRGRIRIRMGPDYCGTSCVMSAIGSLAQQVSRREGSGKEQQTNIIRTRTMGDCDDSTAAAFARAVERRAHVRANKRRPTGRMSDGGGSIVESADWRADQFRARARARAPDNSTD